jgi:hypothetical protein
MAVGVMIVTATLSIGCPAKPGGPTQPGAGGDQSSFGPKWSRLWDSGRLACTGPNLDAVTRAKKRHVATHDARMFPRSRCVVNRGDLVRRGFLSKCTGKLRILVLAALVHQAAGNRFTGCPELDVDWYARKTTEFEIVLAANLLQHIAQGIRNRAASHALPQDRASTYRETGRMLCLLESFQHWTLECANYKRVCRTCFAARATCR